MNDSFGTSEGGGLRGRPTSSPYFAALANYLQTQIAPDAFDAIRTVGVISCTGGEGVTTVAANLAISAANNQIGPVLLIDANFGRPAIPKMFDVQPTAGLSDVFSGDRAALEVLEPSPFEHLSLMAAGEHPKNDRALFNVRVAQDMFEVLSDVFGFIVVDLAPMSESSISGMLAAQLDCVLLVVEDARVQEQTAHDVCQKLVEVGARLLGVVYNKANPADMAAFSSTQRDGFHPNFANNP